MKNIVLPVTPVLQGLLPNAEPDHQADDGQEQQTNSNGHAGLDRETSRCPQTAADHGGVAAVADQGPDGPGHVPDHLGHSLHHLKAWRDPSVLNNLKVYRILLFLCKLEKYCTFILNK